MKLVTQKNIKNYIPSCYLDFEELEKHKKTRNSVVNRPFRVKSFMNVLANLKKKANYIHPEVICCLKSDD